MIADLLPTLIVFKSPQERSALPIPINFDVNIHATKKQPWCKEVNIFDAKNDCYHL